MRGICFCSLALAVLACSGCSEMRIEGDAKVFQTSAVGSIIRTVIGIGLIGLGAVAIAGSVMADRKPKNRNAKPSEKLSSGQRVGLAMFGGAMGFIGLFLAGISLLFPNKLHVTVHPDRVEMASTYSQTGGKEVVIPFASLASVELRDEPNVIGKLQTYLVFTRKNGNVIKQDAGNNERQAVDTIRQALADYQANPPARVEEAVAVAPPVPDLGAPPPELPTNSSPAVAPRIETPKAAPTSQQHALKRYLITIPVPADYSIVGPDAVIEVGTKLKACYAGSWSTVTVVANNDDGTITCNWDSFPSYTYRMMREDLTMATQNATVVNPNATAANPNPAAAPINSPPSKYSLKRYKIDIPIPDGHSVVGSATEVNVGMKLKACYAGRWEFVTVVDVNDDGTIACNWDRWQAFTYNMMREDLITED